MDSWQGLGVELSDGEASEVGVKMFDVCSMEAIMRLRCSVLGHGPGPSETIVEIKTTDGRVEVVVDDGLIHDDALIIRRVVERSKNKALVELPEESTTGRWRVWVSESALVAG